tara:strand:- start:1760 stop:2077 length:318 start_codon:yes stop_codon:yes gene_type:complete
MLNKALIIGILLVGATFSISANEVQKWEYKCEIVQKGPALVWGKTCKGLNECEYVEDKYNNNEAAIAGVTWRFNQLGEEGWELTTTAYDARQSERMVCFKRPKKS